MNKKDVRLIPFTVNSVFDQQGQIPEGVQMVGAPKYWEDAYNGKGVVVAVLDTGAQVDHPDLQGQIIGGRNFTDDHNANPDNFYDNNGHGTHVAGTIAANFVGGIVGVAPQAKLLICKVLDAEGSGTYEGIVRAIEYAINWEGPNGEKVRVINMSLGGPEGTDELYAAVKSAVDNEIAVVVAAGNEGDDNEDTHEFAYPAAYNEVIEIGAIDYDRKLAYFSNNNIEVDAVAPGVDILSTYPGSKYARLSGTSMAAPHAAGVLALIIQRAEFEFNRSLTEAEIYAQLIKNTESLGYRKSSEGNGLIKLNRTEIIEKMIDLLKNEYC